MSSAVSTSQVKRILSFHIGSGSISATVTEVLSGGMPHIIFSVTRDIQPQAVFTFSDFKTSSFKTLAMVCDDIGRLPMGTLDEVVCFLGSPWFATQIRTVHTVKNAPFAVTDTLIAEILKKDRELFQKNELSGYATQGDQAVIFEQELSQILLNGYQIKQLQGLLTKEIDLVYLISIASETLLKEFTTAIARPLHTKDIIFRSFVHAHVSVARDLLVSHDSFLALDVSGELTDVSLVQAGVMTQTTSFPFGFYTLLRFVADSLSIEIGEAESLLSLHASGKLESRRGVTLAATVEKALAQWVTLFERGVDGLSTHYNIPHLVVLTTKHSMSHYLKQAVVSESMHQFTNTSEPFSIVVINPAMLASFFKSEVPQVNGTEIIESLLLAAKQTLHI
jgi:hypothetical protein